MRFALTLVCTAALVIAAFASTAQAQDGLPVSVTQNYPVKWDWGYVGLEPSIGFWGGTRFGLPNPNNTGLSKIDQDLIYGGKFIFGVGSDKDVHTEFFLSMIREGYTVTETVSGRISHPDQWIGRFGFNFICECVSNESINAKGEVTREGRLGVSLIAGAYWLFFPDKNFDINPTQANDLDTRIEDDTLWLQFGIAFDIPMGSYFSISAFAKAEAYVYRLERLKGVPVLEGIFGDKIDRDSYTFETVAEKYQLNFGGMLSFTPHFGTHNGRHWRFYGGVTFVVTEKPLPDMIMITAGVNFGW